MFQLNHQHLLQIAQLNHFNIDQTGLVFVGLRGCSPIDENDNEFREAVELELNAIDYTHLRCTMLQWNIDKKTVAAFPASTVPHEKHVSKSVLNNGVGTNRLMTGFYRDYRKGYHKAGKPTGHAAFRQDGKLPIRRTADDTDYDAEDRVEFVRPYDNIHASWCPGMDYPKYASAGCQVIMGFPKCSKRGANSQHTGPWRAFQKHAYDIEQVSFNYMLLNGRDFRKVAINPNKKYSARLRYGSNGPLVGTLQQALKEKDYYEGFVDKDFGPRTLFALLNFQSNVFGHDADDGVVGPMTAGALGIDW